MITAHIVLTDAENNALENLSQSAGKTRQEILHDAVEQFLAQNRAKNRLSALRQARGMWQKRDDLPDFAQLRQEWDR